MKFTLLLVLMCSAVAICGCTKRPTATAAPDDARTTSALNSSEYAKRLLALKARYPFSQWSQNGMPQYTRKACASFVAVFDHLIADLATLGENAPEREKLECFHRAVVALNELNKKDQRLIETGEREELCDLCNTVAIAAGLDPKKYGDGEGPASQWRDW